MELTDCRFRSVTFGHASFERVVFTNCSFEECTFEAGAIRESTFDDSVLRSCVIRDVGFQRSTILASRFERCDARSVYFEDCAVKSSSFSGRWNGVSVKDTDLVDVDLTSAQTREWTMWRVTAENVRLPSTQTAFFVRGSAYKGLLRTAREDVSSESLGPLGRITDVVLPDVMSADESSLDYPEDSGTGGITPLERQRLQAHLFAQRLESLDQPN
jgi:Pentapeptide repeats (9 copies)